MEMNFVNIERTRESGGNWQNKEENDNKPLCFSFLFSFTIYSTGKAIITPSEETQLMVTEQIKKTEHLMLYLSLCSIINKIKL